MTRAGPGNLPPTPWATPTLDRCENAGNLLVLITDVRAGDG
ncbi:MAG: hypothetical protein SOW59_03255 [Corynebacterium sp.]|nr:hypothetical protein [Corynebacterium sp.]